MSLDRGSWAVHWTLPLSVVLLVLLASPAAAGTINVLGFVDYGPGSVPSGTVNLGGDRGFTLNASTGLGEVVAAAQCSVPSCFPGTTINLRAFSVGSDLFGQATLDGVFYPNVGDIGCPPPFPCAGGGIAFSGQTVAPPFGPFTKAILKVPVDFSGSFSHVESGGGGSTEQLLAFATATLSLQKFDAEPPFPGPTWQYDSLRYELRPTPEPTTLLLFGTTAAGLGLARWSARRRKQGAVAPIE